MKITPIKTHKIKPNEKFSKILDKYIGSFSEKSILVITSKIISITQGKIVPIERYDKDELTKKEVDYFLPRSSSRYNVMLTIKSNILIPSAGIDESNSAGHYVLWPDNPQKVANKIREYLCRRFKIRYAGVIITDSKTSPLRWGTTGIAIAHSGFAALKDYIGHPDIYGRKMIFTKANVVDGLAAGAVVTMGEGHEQTPLAIIEDLPFVKFQSRNPTKKEVASLNIELEQDLYAPILKAVKWHKGKG